MFVVEEIGIGLIVGLALTWLTLMLRFAEGHGWISEHWVEIPIVALAAACFAAAQAAGGSGFIACFVGGGLGERHKKELHPPGFLCLGRRRQATPRSLGCKSSSICRAV